MTVKLPVRIDFIGSWSDQTDWPYPGAVVNAAVGWDDEYPCEYGPDGFKSRVQGIGTGLGISSIREAGKFIYERSGAKDGYIQHVLDAEAKEGTKGGWQDQIGAVEPGFKLITTHNHQDFAINRRDDHPIMQHIVLFDTGIRREAKAIGNHVRYLIKKSSVYKLAMREVVDMAYQAFGTRDPYEFYKLVQYASGLLSSTGIAYGHAGVPNAKRMWGYKLCGAGGGGYGVAFCAMHDRAEVIQQFREHGLWATIPQLLPGVQVEA